MKDNQNKIILGLIVLLASFLRLFRLTRAGILTDASHYSFRAVGYLDYLDMENQTSPIVWFGFKPWWSFLSFHDHPPLVFFIQNIFFKIFGVSTVSAILPFALFGIGSIIVVYFLTNKLYSRECGYLAAFLLAICNYHVWISRVGYLESILIFFILLSIYYFTRALEQDKYFVYFGLFLGLSFLCKYTAFFLIPAIFCYLFFCKREAIYNKKFWVGLLLCLIVFSPVIIYNLKMYQTRGHFDMQFAALFNQDMSDWPIIQRKVSTDFSESFFAIWENFKNGFSPVVLYLFFVSLGFIIFECVKYDRKKHSLLIALVFFLTLFFALTKTSVYFLSVYAPFVIIILSYFLIRCFNFFQQKKKHIPIVLFVLCCAYIIFFSINTNLFYNAIGSPGKLYSTMRLEDRGFNNLEYFLDSKINIKNGSSGKIRTFQDLFLINSQGILKTNPECSDVFIFDENLNWFGRIWYFQRRAVYQKIFFLSTKDLFSIREKNNNEQDALESLRKHYQSFYFILGIDDKTSDSKKYDTPFSETLEDILVRQFKLSPFIVKNYKGEPAFKIYHFN